MLKVGSCFENVGSHGGIMDEMCHVFHSRARLQDWPVSRVYCKLWRPCFLCGSAHPLGCGRAAMRRVRVLNDDGWLLLWGRVWRC